MTDTFTTGHTLPTAITTENAVLRLRQQRLAAATRAYRARGCRAIRCQNCLLAERFCLCDTIKPQQANSRFCLIMFDTEPLKPSNTGRLIADILPDTHAFLWARTEVDPELLAAISDPLRQPYVVFPEAYAEPERQVINQLPISDKPPLFILLDGTWTEAKRCSVKAPILPGYPCCPCRSAIYPIINYGKRSALNNTVLSKSPPRCSTKRVIYKPQKGYAITFTTSVNNI